MRKILTFILVLCTVTLFAEMRGGALYDPGAMRTGNTALSATGTAALPAYSFSSDPDTGIYSAGADSVGITIGGVERARFLNAADLRFSSSANSDYRGVSFGSPSDPMDYGFIKMRLDSGELRHSAGRMDWGGYQTFYASGTERMRITSSGNVLIGTSTDDGANKLQVNGFTKLGEAATGIKMKVLTGTTAAAEGLVVSVAHGLSVGKIIGYTAEVHYDADNAITPGFTFYAGLQYDLQKGPTSMLIYTHATNSENILSKPFTVIVWYKE